MTTQKHLKITGSSEISWKDAIVKTIEEVSKTINNVCGIKVLEQTAKIQDDKIKEYYAELDITFVVNSDKTE